MASKKVFIEIGVRDLNTTATTKRVTKEVNNLASAQERVNKANNRNREQSGLNNAILIESGRVASDASFGIQGIANNISRLIELGQEFARTNKTTGIKGALEDLKKSFFGVGGVLIGVQLLISFLPKIIKKFEEWKSSIDPVTAAFKNLTDQIGTSAGNFEIYIRTLESSNKSEKEKKDAIDALNREFPEYINQLDEAGLSLDDVKAKTKAATDQNNLFRDSIIEAAMSQAATEEIQKLGAKRLEILRKREDKARELGFKNAEEAIKKYELLEQQRAEGVVTMLTGTVAGTLTEEVTDPAKIVSEFAKEELDNISSLIDEFLKYVNIRSSDLKEETDSNGKPKRIRYQELEIGNFKEQIAAIKALAKVRERYNKRTEALILDNIENEELAIETERTNALSRLELLRNDFVTEAQYKLAVDSLNSYYDQLQTNRKKKQRDQDKKDHEDEKRRMEDRNRLLFALEMERLSFLTSTLGSIGDLMKKNSAAAKGFALAELAGETAIGYMRGLNLAQEIAEKFPGDGVVKAAAFATFYASQIAAVAAAAAKAKNILEGGSVGSDSSSNNRFGGGANAPAFNVVGTSPISQLGTAVAGQAGEPTRAYVVFKDIQNAEEWDTATNNRITLG